MIYSKRLNDTFYIRVVNKNILRAGDYCVQSGAIDLEVRCE